jgi:Beta-lactamase
MCRRATVVAVEGNACIESINELAAPGSLRSTLDRAFQGAPPRGVVVGLRCGARSACVVPSESSASSVCDTARVPVKVGCIAKLFTAMLARHAFERRRLAPDEQVSDLLRAGEARRALRGITVRQLLEHTHGLDDSLLSVTPRDSRGRVDADALVRDFLAVPRLATPGALYSYGNAGACIVAALLERVGCCRYAVQLVETLLEPLGTGAVISGSSICPATGGELALDASDLLNLVAEAVFASPDVWPDEECAGDCGFATPLSGWNPLERGVYLGWKYHGAGWLGHQSVWPGHSVLVRAHPRRKLALIAASSEHAAAVVAARVFGAYLPELFGLQVPARPNAALGLPTGVFRSAAWRVDIRPVDGESALRAGRSDGRDESSAILRSVVPGLWLTRPMLSAFPHVEVVALDRAYLWNGRFVLPSSAH